MSGRPPPGCGALAALSDALNTQGCSVALTGGEWTGYLRRALDVAVSAGLDHEAARAFANLSSRYAAAAHAARLGVVGAAET